MKPNALQKEHDRLTRAIERIEEAAEAKKLAVDAEARAKMQPLIVSLAAIQTAMRTIEDAKQ